MSPVIFGGNSNPYLILIPHSRWLQCIGALTNHHDKRNRTLNPLPLLFPDSLNLLDRSPGRNFPFLHLLQEFRGLNSFNKRTEGSGKQLLCEFPSFMKLFSEILDTSCVELNEYQAAHQHKESKLSKIQEFK